jgi:hypothetical protein
MARVRKAHPVRPSSHATCERIERPATASRATLGAVRASRGSSARARSRGKPERGGKGVLESSGARARLLGVTERPRRAQSDSSKRKKIRGKTKVRCRPCGDSVGSRVSRISRIDGLIDGLIDSRLHARSGPLLSAKISRTTLLARTQITSERAPSPRPRRRGKHGVHRRCPGCGVRGGRIVSSRVLRRARGRRRRVRGRLAQGPGRRRRRGASPPILPRGAPGGGVHARGDRGRPRRLRVRRRQEERLLAGGRVQAARVGGAQPRPALPSHLRRPAHAHPRVPVPRPGGRARRAVVPARVRRRRNADRPILLPRLEAVHGGASPPHPVAAPLPDRASRNRANPRPSSIPPLEDANAKPRSIDRSIDRASRRLRSRRLGVLHSPTDLPAAAPASRPATRAAHRRPLFVPRPLPSPRSPPRR